MRAIESVAEFVLIRVSPEFVKLKVPVIEAPEFVTSWNPPAPESVPAFVITPALQVTEALDVGVAFKAEFVSIVVYFTPASVLAELAPVGDMVNVDPVSVKVAEVATRLMVELAPLDGFKVHEVSVRVR